MFSSNLNCVQFRQSLTQFTVNSFSPFYLSIFCQVPRQSGALSATPLQLFPRGDDNFASLRFPFFFRFFDNNYRLVTLSTNGFLVFSSATRCCSLYMPRLSNSISAHHFDLSTSSLGSGGGIYFQTLNTSSSELVTVQSDVNKLAPGFVPRNAFRVVFANVSALKDTAKVSFEVVLATDTVSSFVTLKYTACVTNQPLIRTPSLNYLDLKGNLITVNISTSSPCNSSNVNVTGIWVFAVTNMLSSISSSSSITSSKCVLFATFFLNYQNKKEY